MRRPKPTRRATAQPVSIPAPYGGLNTLDALAKMPEEDAVVLDNWNPDVSSVSIRKGWLPYADGVGVGAVETLAEYHSGVLRRFLAAGSGGIYNVTSGLTATLLQGGFTSARWQWVNFNGFLLLVNGADNPQIYDGVTLANANWSGPTLTAVVGINVFKSRLYIWENASQDFWYGGTNSVAGAFTRFPLSRVSQLGGNLACMGTWTLDGGDGMDDLAVFVMSSGEVIVYRGSDPGDAASWSLAGIYRIAPPLGIRALCKVGGDLFIVTLEDAQNLTDVLTKGRVGVPLSKISGAQKAAALEGRNFFGWQALVYPKGGRILVNIPDTGGVFRQHVLNTLTGAWGRWTGIAAPCWGIFNDNLYFGDSAGHVRQADISTTDNGVAITSDAQGAWNQIFTGVSGATRKRVAAVRPIIRAEGTLNYSLQIGFDYQPGSAVVSGTIQSTGTLWGSPWGSPWSPPARINTTWRASKGSGVALSPRLFVASKQALSWYRTDLRVERGQNL